MSGRAAGEEVQKTSIHQVHAKLDQLAMEEGEEEEASYATHAADGALGAATPLHVPLSAAS